MSAHSVEQSGVMSRRGVLAGLGVGAVGGAGLFGSAAAEAAPLSGPTPFVPKSVMPVNVKDHGAVGDGETDDTAAIQAAIDAAAATGRPVYFPTGEYVISASLRAAAPLSLMGDGMWHSVVRRTTAEVMVAFEAAVRRVDLAGLGWDGAGQVSNLFEVTAPAVETLAVRACRFTNLRQGATTVPRHFAFASFELREVRDAEFVDNLWHNPAEHAGWGMAVHVPADAGAGRIGFTGNNRVLWLNQGMRILSGDAGRLGGKDTSTELVQIDGAYFDHYWWLLPAGWSGQGSSVTYREDVLTDSSADFSDVPSGRYPQGVVVRAMPVRHAGTVSSADARTITEDGADFSGIGLKRGEIVRSGNVFGVVEAKDRSSDDRIVVEQWLDNDTLLPAPAPAPGDDYTVYGVIIGKAADHDPTHLSFADTGSEAHWHDLHGNHTTPEDGTRYEVLQTQVGYHVLCVIGVQNARITNSTFRRAYFDQIGGACRNYQVIGNTFVDGQDVGFTGARHGRHIVIGNDFTHQGARSVHVNGLHDVLVGNRSRSIGWIHHGGANAHYVMTGCRWSYAGHNVAATGDESVRAETPGIMIRFPAPGSPSDTCEENTIEHNAFHGLAGEHVRVWGNNVLNNRIIGTANVVYVAAPHGQHIEGRGEGSPEGVLRAVPGSTYLRTDGEPGATFYVKESGDGAAGWTAMGAKSE